MLRPVAVVLVLLLLATPAVSQTSEDLSEVEQGRQAAQQVERILRVVTDPAVAGRVERIGATVAAQTERPQLPWTFRVVEHRFPNAVALPGGFVYVTSAMLQLVRTDHELAGLLAHEAAHVARRHHRRMAQEALRTNFLVMLVAVLVRDPRITTGAQLVGGGILSAFSRELEREADLAAVGYVQRTTWHPVGVLTLLERLAREEQLSAGPDPGAFRTHPTWGERIRAVEEELGRRGIPLHRRISMGFLRVEAGGEGPVGEVRVNGEVVMRLAGGEERARAVVAHLDRIFNEDPSPLDVEVTGVLGEWRIRVAGEPVVVITDEDARLLGRPRRDLAQEYAVALRRVITEDRRRRALGGY
ncbi:MAG: M48 family metalloprotease [Armatimonadota bacterium]|nr:M48 family metalloprotease [Armatimonadota bacterium]MDR7439697.1 M48 family metalloprotease [Armatimonadota bacterium]MDR7562543.1 M48 family metalloprotease [Armatimonadota bacterium]MDR7566877.1 M48 family metalloprotease [Armatimonadota bacterium]MDR7602708.1 M48 family metalloprotease [Armatimonadota bacterium]